MNNLSSRFMVSTGIVTKADLATLATWADLAAAKRDLIYWMVCATAVQAIVIIAAVLALVQR